MGFVESKEPFALFLNILTVISFYFREEITKLLQQVHYYYEWIWRDVGATCPYERYYHVKLVRGWNLDLWGFPRQVKSDGWMD